MTKRTTGRSLEALTELVQPCPVRAMPSTTPVRKPDDALLFRLFTARALLRDQVAEPVRLAELARNVGLSHFHFLRLFHRTFGKTPHQLGIEYRLSRAKELLTETRLPITEICFECGYESLGSFSALFRRAVGCSPREYRLNQRRFWPVNLSFLPAFAPFCLIDGFRGRAHG
jgi:AraC-like DNA-binding protein